MTDSGIFYFCIMIGIGLLAVAGVMLLVSGAMGFALR